MTHRILHILFILVLICTHRASGQLAPDFTITDSDGQPHSLYAGYLNQGKTVLIEVFFTTCPPCNSIAPYMEPLYQEWGAGNHDVEFFDLSNKSFDSNTAVNNYKTNHGHTYPAAGSAGGSLAAVAPYEAGMFGPFTGTPTFIVIAPDGSVQYDVFGSGNAGTIEAIDAAIALTGATKPECFAILGVNESYCSGDSVNVNGQWYSVPGEYTDMISGDCDTLLQITITEDPLEELQVNASFCAGESIQIYGTTYNVAGVYVVVVPSVTSGCDTIVSISIAETPLHTKEVNASFNQGDSVFLYGTWYSDAGAYLITAISITGGCDTLVTLNISEIPDIPGDVTISGFIRKFQSTTGIGGAYVIVSLGANEVARDTTDAQGRYEFVFDSLYVVNNDLQLTVLKSINPLNGVSVLDIVALQKHLLGLELLNSVEKLFAADLNNSKTISVLDIVYLRQLLLGLELNFPTPSTWIFFHESINFGPPGPQPPVIPAPTPVSLQNILGGTQTGIFHGVKIGDLNNTANPLN
jgi:thiol-disulfide isomerase/thioredoxin